MGVEKTQDVAASLQAFETLSDGIIAKTALQFVDFVRRRRRVVDTQQWQKLKSERGVDLYTERVESRSPASSCSSRSSVPTVSSAKSSGPDTGTCSGFESFNTLSTTLVAAFGGGTLRGTLESTMQGLYAETTEQMQLNAAIQYGNILDCGVVQTYRTRSSAKPHEFFGVKFVEKFGHIPGVVDQLCWVERLGTLMTAGRQFGFQLIKSVEIEGRNTEQLVRRVNMSVCYLYCQSGPNAVDVFIRGIVELPGSSKAHRRKETINAAGDYILATIHGRECQRMKTIASLIARSKTERENLNHFKYEDSSDMLWFEPWQEMCSGCQEAMRRPKLVTLSDADNRKRGSRALSESLRGAKLQLRCGSTRCDGELPETATKSYCEAESFRMFLPICDPRPTSNYRLSRKKRENILITMLRRHEHERRNATASRRHSLGS